MTRQTPSCAKAGTWKVMDLPPPVGIKPNVSLPLPTLSIISRCMPRKSSYPQYFLRMSRYLSAIIGSDVFYLQLYLVVLEDVVLQRIDDIEASLAFDVPHGGALPEGDAIDNVAGL